MAVTQLLVMITSDRLDECMGNESSLRELIELSGVSEEEFEDIDWSSTFLKRLFNELSEDNDTEVLNLALSGESELFKDELSAYLVEELPTYLTVDKVKDLSIKLEEIDIDGLISKLPSSISEINDLLKSDFVVDPKVYLKDYFLEIVGIFKIASKRRLCIVSWWD